MHAPIYLAPQWFACYSPNPFITNSVRKQVVDVAVVRYMRALPSKLAKIDDTEAGMGSYH